jgi:hypothetical protein
MVTVSDVIQVAPVTGSGVVMKLTTTLTESPGAFVDGIESTGFLIVSLLIVDTGPDS